MPTRVKDIMIENPLFLKEEQSIFTARELMILNGHECLYVVDGEGRPSGVVSTLHASVEDSKKRVTKVMTKEFECLRGDQTLQEAASAFARKDIQHLALPVVDPAGKMVGLVHVADLIKDFSASARDEKGLTPEASVVQLAMTKDAGAEKEWVARIKDLGFNAAVTQVGTSAEKLPVKLRESAIVAAIAHGVISEETSEKVAVSNAIREMVLQMEMVSPGLGGGYKIGVVRGEGRVAVAACGRCGHALASSPEQIFLGVSVI